MEVVSPEPMSSEVVTHVAERRAASRLHSRRLALAPSHPFAISSSGCA